MVFVGLAAFAAYRKLVVARATRVTVLAVLVLTLIYAGLSFEPMLPNLAVLSFYYGGSSPFTLAMIAFVAADLMLRPARETTAASGDAHAAEKMPSNGR